VDDTTKEVGIRRISARVCPGSRGSDQPGTRGLRDRPRTRCFEASGPSRSRVRALGHACVGGRLAEQATGSTFDAITGARLRDHLVPVPPFAEQQRIVAAIEEHFSRLDAAANAACMAGAKVEASRRSILVEALSGRLTTQNQGEESASKLLDRIASSSLRSKGSLSIDTPGSHERESAPLLELPSGWSWARLQDLAVPDSRAITDGPFGSNLKTAHYTMSGPRVIRLQNIGDGEFKREDAHISFEHFESLLAHSVQPDDLIVASLGELLPRACLVPDWVPPAIVKADCIRVCLHPEVNRHYVNLALQDPRLRRETARERQRSGKAETWVARNSATHRAVGAAGRAGSHHRGDRRAI